MWKLMGGLALRKLLSSELAREEASILNLCKNHLFEPCENNRRGQQEPCSVTP